MNRFLGAFAELVTRHRGPVVILVGVIFLAFGAQIRHLEADFSPQDLHTTFVEQQAKLDAFAEVFGDTENVLLVLVRADDVLAHDVVEYIHHLSLHFGEQDYAERVESLTTTSFALPAGPGEISVGPVVRQQTSFYANLFGRSFLFPGIDEDDVVALEAAVEATPLVRGSLVSERGELAVVAIFLSEGLTKVREARPIVESITDYLRRTPPPAGAKVILGGLPHVRVWVAQHFKSDQILLVPLSLLVCFLILLVSFRWFPGMAIPGLAVIVSAILVVGAMAIAGEPINIINQVVPVLIIIIGVSDSIHMISRYLEEIARGKGPMKASQVALKRIAVACFLTSLTTSVGFASLAVSRTHILVRFGVTAAIGVGFAYFVTIILLPPLLSWTEPRRHRSAESTAEGHSDGRLESLLGRLAEAIIRRPAAFLAGSGLVFAVALYVASLVNVDSRLMEIFRPGDAPYDTINLIQEELDGVMPLELSLSSEVSGRFNDPDLLNAIWSLRGWVLEQDGVLSATGYPDYLHQARVAYRDDPSVRGEPFERVAEVAALASLLEGASPSPIDPYVTFDRRRSRLNIQISDMGANASQRLARRIETQAEAQLGGFEDLEVVLTGNAFVASAGVNSLVHDMFGSLLTAFLIIFALMALLFRSVKMGVLSVPPNLVPLVFTMAYMTIAGIYLNTTTVVAFAISLGLAVDHTIHMLTRFNEELASGADHHAAITGAVKGTGRAITVTSVTLFMGMLVLLLSSFVPVAQFATLIAVTAVSCLLGNLLMLPALLELWARPSGSRRQPNTTSKS